MITYKEEPDSPETIKRILDPTVKEWFFSRFKEFSLPQKYAVSEIHSRQNVLVSAPTGATKTLTAFLSILNELVNSAKRDLLEDKVYCIYISPLKALNEDIKANLLRPLEEMENIYGDDLNIRVAVRTGDTTPYQRQKMVKNPPHILITTPESLSILLASPKFKEHLKGVQWTIIDEIHSLAENKRGVHLSLTLERLERITSHMTRVGLSATISPLESIAHYLIGDKERRCKIVNVQFIKELDLKVMSPVPDLINTTHGEMQHQLYTLVHKLIQQHKTTLIFTNTRSATERVVDKLKHKYPQHYTAENTGAHHGSLSKEKRHWLEQSLRDGKIKCAVCSTSLELGLDIGSIDLVILLGSPKSVARALQRCGRAGHQLQSVTKGRIIVLNRDDLVECAVLTKAAIEKKIDTIHIPTNCLDVLVQHIHGTAIGEKITARELYNIVKKSYCYNNLDWDSFIDVVRYLAGEFVDLEARHVYAKIWYDKDTGEIGRRGKMGRVLHMTNIGTIPDSSGVLVKVNNYVVGTIDEAFLERLKPGDIFVLAGDTYEFRYARGMVANVRATSMRPPTVPSWFSEMLPLSFDLAMQISLFRRLMSEKFCSGQTKEELLEFIHSYLYVDDTAADAIYTYFKEQFDYLTIPTDRRIIIEHYQDERKDYTIFHTVFGRRVNDCLSRAIAFAIGRIKKKSVEVGINDNGFYLSGISNVDAERAFKLLKSSEIRKVLEFAIDKSEVLNRRFRHCAGRSLMILRNYKGQTKRVGRQQVSSTILLSAVKRLGKDFCILREAKREVLEDLMDVENTKEILKRVEDGLIQLEKHHTLIPSPFAFNIVLQGYTDILKMEDRQEFLKRMHEMMLLKTSLKKN